MKYLFFVQIEGRGHLTQSLALAENLRKSGHEIVAVILNKNPNRKIPAFFTEGINAPLNFINSPYFLINKEKTGVDIKKSFIFNLFRWNQYLHSLKEINRLCKKYKPDIIINFFEPLCGLHNLVYKQNCPCFSVGHQFFINHPSFKKPKNHFKDNLYFNLYNKLTSYGSKALIALSFTRERDILKKKILVCPPLIRSSIKNLKPKKSNFILSYILNPGYFQEIKDWSNLNPEQKIEAFWDKKGEDEVKSFNNLRFHLINGEKFINLLKDCSSYISTAGFDSIAEAAYLQKNILMVPTKNHYEQLCNSVDAQRAGLAISDSFFNIDLVLDNQKNRSEESGRIFKNWVDSESEKILDIITLKKIN